MVLFSDETASLIQNGNIAQPLGSPAENRRLFHSDPTEYLLTLKIREGHLMTPTSYAHLIEFLREELGVPDAAIAIAQRHCEQDPGPLPMVLWQYGLVTLEQLDRIYDWLETA